MTRVWRHEPAILLTLGILLLIASGLWPRDRVTWLLEVFPILVGIPILVFTARRFPLTPLTYRLIFAHALLLMVGGYYTYSKVPLGFWVQDLFGLARNHYDRLGHFAQGFVPAIIAREVLLRTSPLVPGGWLFFLVLCVCLALSAAYEFIEWWASLRFGKAADEFLGMQGDPWDTQWDMFLCLVGAAASQLLLARLHDRALKALAKPRPRSSRSR